MRIRKIVAGVGIASAIAVAPVATATAADAATTGHAAAHVSTPSPHVTHASVTTNKGSSNDGLWGLFGLLGLGGLAGLMKRRTATAHPGTTTHYSDRPSTGATNYADRPGTSASTGTSSKSRR